MIQIKNYPLIFAFIFLITGCASIKVHDVKPEDLSSKGILVGTVVGGAGIKSGYDIFIDGERYNVRYIGNTFMVSLPPGKHTLESMRHSSSGGIGPSVISTYTLNKTFTIRAGKITNLGGMYFASKRMLGVNDDLKRYNIVHVDNSRFIERYLKRYHQDIYNSLSDKTIYPSSHKFLTKSELQGLRELIARSLVRPYNGEPDLRQANRNIFVTSLLGTAGWVTTDGKGLPKKFTPLRLDTLNNVLECDIQQPRYVCIIASPWPGDDAQSQLLLYKNNRRQPLSLPQGSNPFKVRLFGDDGLAFGDYDYKLYTRKDSNSDWNTHQKAGVKPGIVFIPSYSFANTEHGLFSLYKGKKPALALTSYNDGSTRPIDLPEDFKSGKYIVGVDDGIVFSPSKANVYKRYYSGEWKAIELPSGKCSKLYKNHQNKRLEIHCGGKPAEVLASTDGENWQQVN